MLIKTNDGNVFRILDSTDTGEAFIINCTHRSMPKWVKNEIISDHTNITEDDLYKTVGIEIPDMKDLPAEGAAEAQRKFTLISPILPVMTNEQDRSAMIRSIASMNNLSKQVIRKYLCLYLIYQNKAVLAPKQILKDETLTQDQKNFRWALKKYYYQSVHIPLRQAYLQMIAEKYLDEEGNQKEKIPTYHQFMYFHRTHKNLREFFISRNGINNYKRNNRPLLGDGVREYADRVGVGMLDSTICDIYLKNEENKVVGRPILTACIDAYSGLCNGYMLSWEGGVYSLRGLLLNVVSDKVEHCRKFGIEIDRNVWDSDKLPGKLVTDKGSEYKSFILEQITELGVDIVNLDSYRPDLKGVVERFFGLVQKKFKDVPVRGGVVIKDYIAKELRDHKETACLTMDEFEKIIVRIIIYYNTGRLLSNFPFTDEMINDGVKPFCSSIWEWGKRQEGANLIDVDPDRLIKTLLPREKGVFKRKGLIVNNMRYRNKNYIEKYLSGDEATVAYDPDSNNKVWLIDNGEYIEFELIERVYKDKTLTEAQLLEQKKKELEDSCREEQMQAEIDVNSFIQDIFKTAIQAGLADRKNIKKTREVETVKTHINYIDIVDKENNNE